MKKFDPKTLPYIAAFIQMFQFAHAGYIYAGKFGAVALGLVGIGVSLNMAVASSKINDISVKRKKSAWLGFWGLIIFSPTLIGVAMFYYIDVPNIYARVIVAALWGLASDIPVALSGFITGKGLVQTETSSTKTGTSVSKNKTRRNQSRSNAMKKHVQCPTCKEFMSQAKLNNHKAKCKIAHGIFAGGNK